MKRTMSYKIRTISDVLQEASIFMHKRTGYSINHTIIEVKSDNEMRNKYTVDFFIFNSIEWQLFLDLIDEACK